MLTLLNQYVFFAIVILSHCISPASFQCTLGILLRWIKWYGGYPTSNDFTFREFLPYRYYLEFYKRFQLSSEHERGYEFNEIDWQDPFTKSLACGRRDKWKKARKMMMKADAYYVVNTIEAPRTSTTNFQQLYAAPWWIQTSGNLWGGNEMRWRDMRRSWSSHCHDDDIIFWHDKKVAEVKWNEWTLNWLLEVDEPVHGHGPPWSESWLSFGFRRSRFRSTFLIQIEHLI